MRAAATTLPGSAAAVRETSRVTTHPTRQPPPPSNTHTARLQLASSRAAEQPGRWRRLALTWSA
jgi:hypothetical protein